MSSETPLMHKLPILDFSKEELLPGTDDWVSVRAEACKALEEYGCFEAVYDHKFPEELHNAIFGAQMEELFSLPLETKNRNTGDKLYHGYIGNRPHIPLHESMGINDVQFFERIQHFTNLMWPQGNDSFCENLHVYMNLVLDLTKTVTRMVFEGYGVEKYYDSHMESITNLLRILKYRAPLVDETKIGGNTHTDKSFITILHQNHVNGLEIQTKSGEWITATPSPNSFIVMIGDAFLAWSNDRLYSPQHRVMMTGDSDTRYSTALFTFSKGIVRVPEELVDEEHPLMFKPFDNMGYVDFYVKPGEQPNAESTIKAYCGV